MVRSRQFSNPSKLSCMISLPASIKRIRSRTAEKKLQHVFSHFKSIRIFSDAQGPLTMVVRSSQISPQALMHVIVTSKYGKERMKKAKKMETPVFPS